MSNPQGDKPDQLTAERVRSLLAYDPDTGVLTRRVRMGRAPAGSVAGCLTGQRFVISVDGRQYLAHRVIWLLVHGAWPEGLIDHRNHNSADNRLANLRTATPLENVRNTRVKRNSKTGVKGVTRDKESGQYIAFIRDGRRRINLGRYSDLDSAGKAYREAATRLHKEFACHG